jgi:hypothetical protein
VIVIKVNAKRAAVTPGGGRGNSVIIVPTPGSPGPQGPAGDGGFTHTQSMPAATWTITNTLGRYPASVLIVVGTELVDADVEFPDIATIVIIFASPTAGRAEIL